MSESFEPLEGGCVCGQVRYSITNSPLIVHACHCSWCQRQTGAAHVINALYESEFVQLTKGEVEAETVPSPSEKGQKLYRCPKCKVTLWSNYLGNGMGDHLRFVRVGTLDEPGKVPPDIHIFTSTKLPWYVIPDDQNAVETYYKEEEVWSPESRARIAIVDKRIADEAAG